LLKLYPYKTFKERLQLMKKYVGKSYIEIWSGYVYIERIETREQ
jgi:hypothetical protein